MNQGTTHWNAKLTDQQIRAIRQSNARTLELARIFRINSRYVRKLRRGHARKQVN